MEAIANAQPASQARQAGITAAGTLYRHLFESSTDGLIILDAASGTVLDVNPALVAMLGYSHEVFLGHAIREIGVFSEAWASRSDVSRLGEGAYVRCDDLPLHTADGRRIEVEFVSSAYSVEGKRVVQCNIRDVTERRRAERAMGDSEAHFRFLSDLGQATCSLSDPARIMEVSTRMLGEHLGASRCAYADVEEDGERFTILHDFTNRCASVVGNFTLSAFGDRAADTLSHGRTLIIGDVRSELGAGAGADTFGSIGVDAIICCPLVRKGRLRAMMAVHQTSARDWNPSEIRIVQEVSRRCWATIESRTAAEKTRQLNIELQTRVAERTEELEATNKELEAFSYSVSHDLRAPLRAVDGFAQAVTEDYGSLMPKEGLRYLQIIRQGTQKMGALIDDLLKFSRLGRAALHKQTVDCAGQVAEVVDETRAAHPDSPVQVIVGHLPDCSGDPALLRQVWINLVSNAFKFSHGVPSPRVEVGSDETTGECVYFVRDNGKGFDMRYAAKLFGVFQRLHRAEDFEGTGVGLAIVQRILTRHGGRIWADSKVDEGATFFFTVQPRVVQ